MFGLSSRRTEDPRLTWLFAAVAAALTLIYIVGAHRILSSWNPDLGDYTLWYDHILRYGRWHSVNGSFSSYNPPYIYVLALASNLSGLLHPVAVLKLLNVPFMLASGALTFSICRRLGCTQRRALVAAWLIVVCPEIVANALVWGQTDILETTFVLLFVFLLLARLPGWAMAALGVALSFKLQVIFLAPAILALLLTRELPLWSPASTLFAYLVMLVPALVEGRPLRALFGAYSAQTGTADRISMGAANLYSLVTIVTGNEHVDSQHPFFVHLEQTGVVFAALVTLLLVLFLVKQKPLISGPKLIAVVACSALAEPFLLPKMHDRYFFIGDVLVLLLALVDPRNLVSAILLQISALMVYARYLIGFHVNAWYYVPAMLMTGIAICLLLRRIARQDLSEDPLNAQPENLAQVGPVMA